MTIFQREAFMNLMLFPLEWEMWEMYSDELFAVQLADYSPGSEEASEHFRYGAFLWWLSKDLSQNQKEQILQLTHLDPDQIMASDIRERLAKRGRYPLV